MDLSDNHAIPSLSQNVPNNESSVQPAIERESLASTSQQNLVNVLRDVTNFGSAFGPSAQSGLTRSLVGQIEGLPREKHGQV